MVFATVTTTVYTLALNVKMAQFLCVVASWKRSDYSGVVFNIVAILMSAELYVSKNRKGTKLKTKLGNWDVLSFSFYKCLLRSVNALHAAGSYQP